MGSARKPNRRQRAPFRVLVALLWASSLSGHGSAPAGQTSQGKPKAETALPIQTFEGTGVIEELHPKEQTITIAHRAIGSYMPAMTMPFKVRPPAELSGLALGDRVSFRLRVSSTESWLDRIRKLHAERGPRPAGIIATPAASRTPAHTTAGADHSLLDFPFTNELGQPVRLRDFRGQALAVTFFFTRCPLPEFCPRLSKNFEEASARLEAMRDGPTNWHFLSVSFDPGFDTPAVLRAYARQYHYDPRHWSFLTGPADKIHELAAESDVTYQGTNGVLTHNFRTLVVDARGHLQMVFPMGGDLSEPLVSEVLKAAAAGGRQR